MFAYHGTSENVARIALDKGIVPRSVLGIKSLWDIESRDDLVYLSVAFAPTYGINACALRKEQGDTSKNIGIVEVDLDRLIAKQLLPDEDCLAQLTMPLFSSIFNKHFPKISGYQDCEDLESRTRWFRERLEIFEDGWRVSLKYISNIAYKGSIPREAIRRIAIYDVESNAIVTNIIASTPVNTMTYANRSEYYQSISNWFFDPEIKTIDIIPSFYDLNKVRKLKDLNNRKGITIINNDKFMHPRPCSSQSKVRKRTQRRK